MASFLAATIYFTKKPKPNKSGLLQKQTAKICFKVFRSMFGIHVLLINKTMMEVTAQQAI